MTGAPSSRVWPTSKSLSLAIGFDSEHESQPPEDLSDSVIADASDSLPEPRAIDRAELGHVHNTRLRKARFSFAEPNVARHVAESEIRGDRRDDHGVDPAAVEVIRLDDDRRASTGGLGSDTKEL